MVPTWLMIRLSQGDLQKERLAAPAAVILVQRMWERVQEPEFFTSSPSSSDDHRGLNPTAESLTLMGRGAREEGIPSLPP